MKKLILVLLVLISACLCQPAEAQVRIRVNLGLQPIWGPVGYDYVDYYYIPDIDAYYSVPRQEYTYYDGRWITSPYLPPRYRDFDLYRAHKIVINEQEPWLRHEHFKGRYGQYRGHHDQVIIRDSRDHRYYENPNHPMHHEWHGNEGRGREGHREGHGNEGRGHDGHGEGHGREEHEHGRH